MFSSFTQTITRRPKRALAIGAVAAVTVAGVQTAALAQITQELAQPARAALTPTKSLTITKDGTVVDGALVSGSIAVKADNVTIKNSKVQFGGYHSIRIYPGASGTRILDTTVDCQKARTNGVVFGNYRAERVHLNGCRNDFMSSDAMPATVVDSWIDGKAFSLNVGGSNSTPTTPSPTTPSPTTPAPTTPAPMDFPSDFPSDFPTEFPSDFPSGFPTELPSDFPTEALPSDW
ncbi:MAG: hypothetical protein ACI379_06130, partial [Nocardioides sp.]